MASRFLDIIFFVAVTAIVAAQVVILRSTRRGMRHAGITRGLGLEWTFALLPALTLILLLAASWRAMHATTIRAEVVVPIVEGSRT